MTYFHEERSSVKKDIEVIYVTCPNKNLACGRICSALDLQVLTPVRGGNLRCSVSAQGIIVRDSGHESPELRAVKPELIELLLRGDGQR